MGIIDHNVKAAINQYRKTGNLRKLALKLICDADYSIRAAWMLGTVLDAIRKHIPNPSFECLWYDGEHGNYHLLDFDPNGLESKTIEAMALACLKKDCGLGIGDIPKWEETLYLIDTNCLFTVKEVKII